MGLATALFTLITVSNVWAAPHSPGALCAKVGVKATSGKTPVKCIKSGKKLIWQTVKKSTLKSKPTPKPSTTLSSVIQDISVTAAQWNWKFTYVKAGTSGMVSDPSAQPPILYIPQGETVRFTLNSNDVSHGFWIPGLLINVKVTPGGAEHLDFTATKLGTYPGRCNVVCGREHTSMIFTANVVTPAEYETYLATLKVG